MDIDHLVLITRYSSPQLSDSWPSNLTTKSLSLHFLIYRRTQQNAPGKVLPELKHTTSTMYKCVCMPAAIVGVCVT